MFRRLLALVILGVAICYGAAAADECPSRALAPVTSIKGIRVALVANEVERLSDRVPLVLRITNSTPSNVPVQYEPLAASLRFDVVDGDGRCLESLDGPLGGRTVLFHNRFLAGLQIDLLANLTEWVPIARPGIYEVVARFHPHSLDGDRNAEFRTEPLTITVVP